ncbi:MULTISPECIES: rhodanese-like domain-containing protein [Anoxybacillus]|uniref:Rhodanese-like domain protein n=1 Tax=Anoxybacillus flavithermus TaxID=33934 RepID=A0A178TD12_9BACL|nr:rhodanese-like domain-containing protein [Anoxybacillus flavithermus]MBE2905590.1 rhodanese-like domain-containing protein [Anoxybacillus flavithermus]MBE2907322.1 rhodanese-like domain-containing protein [Anoxybacillus flavithermus]MBE2909860.1 rhodanese-like domain-containing protein [Anoxybacillus flavithermus]MBE2913451.1 rhodanese-like domain-containing protein [Anoxybacillus flavithermus]MBE2915153.1 rhodanese-like domain-containing protein [Anoxybacillus flavithermus]
MGTWINVVLIILLIYFVAAKILAKNGFERVVNVRGGMNAWNG